MNDRRRQDERNENPPNSRLFVVCSKSLTEEDLRSAFSPYGEIIRIHMPRDRDTGNSKGVAFIRYAKTSEAALAMQEMASECLGPENKPLKVMVASNRDDMGDVSEDRLKRLFIVSKTAVESELHDHFSQFGVVKSILLQRCKDSDQLRGFAYVTFESFLSAAKALEGCDKHYKAVFAEPRESMKRVRSRNDSGYRDSKNCRSTSERDYCDDRYRHPQRTTAPVRSGGEEYTSVKVRCSSQLGQQHIEKLFNIIPGMINCRYSYEGGCGNAIVTYDNHNSAAHAVQRMHQLEYPLGDTLSVLPESLLTKVANDLSSIVQNFKEAVTSRGNITDLKHLADVMSQASSMLKTASDSGGRQGDYDRELCNVRLPPSQPLAPVGKECVKRCFIVCATEPLPSDVLHDVFSRFGDLKNVYLLPNKNYGFANYASEKAADDAKKTLHGAVVANVMLKVLDAEVKKEDDSRISDAKNY